VSIDRLFRLAEVRSNFADAAQAPRDELSHPCDLSKS
jgi:hypothetical protein